MSRAAVRFLLLIGLTGLASPLFASPVFQICDGTATVAQVGTDGTGHPVYGLTCTGTVSFMDAGANDFWWQMPSTEAIQAAFAFGFNLPLICFLVSWAYGVVINFATRDVN